MDFNWDGLSKEKYINSKQKLNELIDCCIGNIRIGEICIDVVIRYYGEPVYTFDFYVANEDTGYGYKENIAYDYAEGTEMYMIPSTYEDFTKRAEKIIMKFILDNDNQYGYSLWDKAKKQLLIW